MAKKIAGKLNQPPTQADFDGLALAKMCGERSGICYRLHGFNRATGNPWPPLHFSRQGNSRFDPTGGIGALCVAETLQGALMELFDDYWGPVGSIGRSITEQALGETWVSLISLPKLKVFDATGSNLSKLGTDAQLLTGQYSTTRKWALRLMDHPDQADGILYRSRHDPSRLNIALFNRDGFLPAVFDPDLTPSGVGKWKRKPAHGAALVHGPAVVLRNHPLLHQSLIELQAARLP